jgi:hypothetical protein
VGFEEIRQFLNQRSLNCNFGAIMPGDKVCAIGVAPEVVAEKRGVEEALEDGVHEACVAEVSESWVDRLKIGLEDALLAGPLV